MSRKKRTALIIGATLLLLLILAAWILWIFFRPNTPTLSIADVRGEGEIAVPVTLSSLGDAVYPAASAEILFDNTRLRFLGVDSGEVTVASAQGRQIPTWQVNPDRCNQTGKITLLYLDTALSYSFNSASLPARDAVLFTLRFASVPGQTGGSALTFSDAVFAASDEKESLSMANGSLRTKDGTVTVGEAAK